MVVLITGGTGLVGSHLTVLLASQGYTVRHLSRSKYAHLKAQVFEWNIGKGLIEEGALDDVDVIVHLAGSSVASSRWTASKKRKIYNSRIKSTELLFEHVSKMNRKPQTLICASGTGSYGAHPFTHMSYEEDAFGEDFLAQVCKDWEAAADKFTELGIRVVKPRFGVVLAETGGALKKIMGPIKLGIGSPLGSGQQIQSWIHIQDLVGMLNHFISNPKTEGVYNTVAHAAITNEQLTRIIGKQLNRPIWLPNVPAFVLKLMLGEMSHIVLTGHYISNKKILDTGFEFTYQTAEKAIEEILSKA